MYDIVVVGAGPAGTTLARLLGGRCRVLLLDSARPKCCGGILTPEAQKMFARFDLAVPKEVLVDPQPFAVAVVDVPSRMIRHYARQYVNVDRSALDHWLLSLVPEAVERRSGALYRSSKSTGQGLTVRFQQGDRTEEVRTRYLVGADGAFSTVRREFFSSQPFPRRYLSVQEWFDLDEVVSDEEVGGGIDFRNDYVGLFDPELTDFYCWTIPKNRRIIVGGAFPFGRDVKDRMRRLKEKVGTFGLQLKAGCRREAGQLVRPISATSICLGSNRVLLVGEAAGLVSPSSAEGISPALSSAEILADSFHGGVFDAAEYRRRIRWTKWGILAKNLKVPVMFAPWIRKQVMRSGLTALDKRVHDE